MEPIVELERLSVRLGRQEVLRDLSVRLTGRAIGLLGPNGAGKSTLLHTLLGFHPPTAGTVRVLGRDVARQPLELRQSIGYMPENDSFIAGMSGIRSVRLMAELSGLPPTKALERAHESLHFVGVGEERYRDVAGFSLGMKQKIKLAQALVHAPRLLLLDEPTNGLDPSARARMLQLIREIRDSGDVHVIVSSHLLHDVESCCEEVLVLRPGGEPTYCDISAERRTNRKFIELEYAGDPDTFVGAVTELGCDTHVAGDRSLKLVLPDTVDVDDIYRVAAGRDVLIRRLTYKRDSLEEIFMKAME